MQKNMGKEKKQVSEDGFYSSRSKNLLYRTTARGVTSLDNNSVVFVATFYQSCYVLTPV